MKLKFDAGLFFRWYAPSLLPGIRVRNIKINQNAARLYVMYYEMLYMPVYRTGRNHHVHFVSLGTICMHFSDWTGTNQQHVNQRDVPMDSLTWTILIL